MPKAWAIYDTKDNLWIGAGEDDHVRVFKGGDTLPNGRVVTEDDAYMLAQLAAQIVDIRMGWDIGRCRAREFEGGPMTVRDEQTYIRPMKGILARIERGTIL